MGGALSRAGARALTTVAMGVLLVVALVVGPSGAAGNTTPSAGAVDLSVEVTAQPDAAMAGSVFQFTGLVRNRGTLVAEEVEGIFVIPAARIAAGAGSQSCTIVGSSRLDDDGSSQDQPWTVTCDLGTLSPGAEARVAFTVTTGPHGTQMSVATVASRLPDARPSDNRVETPIYVLPETPGFTPAFQQPARINPLGRTTA